MREPPNLHPSIEVFRSDTFMISTDMITTVIPLKERRSKRRLDARTPSPLSPTPSNDKKKSVQFNESINQLFYYQLTSPPSHFLEDTRWSPSTSKSLTSPVGDGETDSLSYSSTSLPKVPSRRLSY
jgi:hypothetical protein